MKRVSSPQISLTIVAMAMTFLMFACRKNDASALITQSRSNDKLAILSNNENRIRINQAIEIYDSSQIKDSIDFIFPTPDKYYKWEVIPSTADSIIGDKGISKFIFKNSGTYLITAKIFDSLTHNLIGSTDTLEINVTTDTLHPIQPIKQDDILNIQTGIVKVYSDKSLPPDEVNVYLNLLSTESYENYSPYLQFDYISTVSPNNFNYVFSDIKLTSYPFAPGTYDVTDKVYGWIDLKGLSYGTPANLSITWLGITYRGSITLLNENQYTVNWDNSGAVKIK